MRVKYNSSYAFCTLYITNKTPFRIRVLFHILDLLRIDPTSFGGGKEGLQNFGYLQLLGLVQKGVYFT